MKRRGFLATCVAAVLAPLGLMRKPKPKVVTMQDIAIDWISPPLKPRGPKLSEAELAEFAEVAKIELLAEVAKIELLAWRPPSKPWKPFGLKYWLTDGKGNTSDYRRMGK